MFPRLGIDRPSQSDARELAVWAGNMEFFVADSGVVPGAGIGGGGALRIFSVAGVGSAAFFAPVAVKPATACRVESFLKSVMNPGGIAGAGIAEYDTVLPTGEQPPREVLRSRPVGLRDGVRLAGARDWQRHAFPFRTSPRTRMVHLVLHRDGIYDRAPVFFDDIRIAEEP